MAVWSATLTIAPLLVPFIFFLVFLILTRIFFVHSKLDGKYPCVLLTAVANAKGNAQQSTPQSSPTGASIDNARKVPRLSKPVSIIRPEYDVVVVGSGYGGGVAASRMARAGKSVCVLERGSERWPSEYPQKFKDAIQQLHISGSKSSVKSKTHRLIRLVRGEGQDVLVGSGLGGTSLINANVFLRADHRTLELSEWPEEIRTEPDALGPYYVRVERVFQQRPYPETLGSPAKSLVFEDLASKLGLAHRFYRPPLALSFENRINTAGVQLNATTSSGNDCTGLNDGSKKTVLMTYLPDAWNWGAEIFCEVEVKYIIKDAKGNGYLIFFEAAGVGEIGWVKARELIFLGAGALGTTEILLRSQVNGLDMSPMVGQKVSGNGDVLAFAYNTSTMVNGVGRKPAMDTPCGPTITSCIDMRENRMTSNVRDGFVVQEGAITEALAPIIQGLLEGQAQKRYPTQYARLRSFVSQIQSWILGPYSKGGSINRTLTYLVMSHDTGEGILSLEADTPSLKFFTVPGNQQTTRIQGFLEKACDVLKGVLINAPSITVHPLGSARMSSDGTGRLGAVNHIGQLFTGFGDEVHEGVFCVDGSVIPTSLGVNPCATITALAERTCEYIVKQENWVVDATPNGALDLFGTPARSIPPSADIQERWSVLERMQQGQGISFTETLEGYVHIGRDVSDFDTANCLGRRAASSARLSIAVDVYDLDQLAQQCSSVTGTLSCGVLSRDPLRIMKGEIRFFTIDKEIADGKNLIYRMKLLSTTGETFLLEGFKRVDPSIAFSVRKTWKATTTLYTTIMKGNREVVGRGILHLSLPNFLRELRSIKSRDTRSIQTRAKPPALFLLSFTANLLSFFLAPFRTLEYPPSFPDVDDFGYFNKPTPDQITLTTDDGIHLPLKIWEPKPDIPVHNMAIILIPGASVDDGVFSLPTIHTNTIDYLTSHGYRCYVPIVRFGITEESKHGWTAFDARLDIKAAMEYVRKNEGGSRFYVICHCLGSIATSMALLNGDVPADWITGMTCSQVFTDLIFSQNNNIKARAPMLLTLYRSLSGPWLPLNTPPTTPLLWLLDFLLRFYPIGHRKELCRSSTCHRSHLPFGRCFTHAHLNHATHAHMHRWFSGIHMAFLSHLTCMGAIPPFHPRTNFPAFTDLVETGLHRLEGLKIMFLSGGSNVVFDPRSTETSFERLRNAFPGGRFERVVVGGYGHLDTWMGVGSVEDVYPRVLGHVRRCGQDEWCGEDGFVDVVGRDLYAEGV